MCIEDLNHNEAVKAEVLRRALKRNPNTTEDAVEEVTDYVLVFCSLNRLPPALVGTMARMAVALFDSRKEAGAEEVGPITSIKEGDTTVSFAATRDGAQSAIEKILSKFESDLRKFRKLVW